MVQQRAAATTMSPATLAVILALAGALLFGTGAFLVYCGIQPFGSPPPPPAVCWIGGPFIILLSIVSAWGAYYFSKRPKPGQAAASPGSSRTAATTASNSVPVNGSKPAHKAGQRIGMREAMMLDPDLQQRMGNLIEALVHVAPAHYAMIHLLVEARRANGNISILFTHGSPVLLNEYSTLVPDAVSNGAFAVIDYLLRQDEGVPGFEVELRKTAGTKWDADFHRLDEPHPNGSTLPRYPIRVCGRGFSLAPPADAIYRWSRNLNPPAIVAAARKSTEPSFKRAQITFADSSHRLLLEDGATKAEEVIQIGEGPATPQWTIETPIFHATWPDGLDLRYPLASKTRFDLLGTDDSLIFVQGPAASENLLDGMAAEGQTEAGRGTTPSGHQWIELGYQVEGVPWRQRHYARPVSGSMSFVVTAQCPESPRRGGVSIVCRVYRLPGSRKAGVTGAGPASWLR
jgi:hypothetical protein